MRTKKEARAVIGKKLVDVTFRRFQNNHGGITAEPVLHFEDGVKMYFTVYELPDDYAVEAMLIRTQKEKK